MRISNEIPGNIRDKGIILKGPGPRREGFVWVGSIRKCGPRKC